MIQNIPSVLLIFLISNLFHCITCDENVARQLSCTSENELFRYEEFETKFYLSTRKQKHQRLTPKNIVSGEIDFDPTRRIVVIAHGYLPNGYLELMNNLRDAVLQWNDVNVIYVDWEKGCFNPLNYTQAARNTEYAAIRIKDLFKYLIGAWNGTSKSVEHWGPLHFIGLSLGAHVVGQAAELLKNGNEPFIDRVTGLDPAEPCFDNADSPLRLKKSNARYVDVIHTDIARSLNTGLGLLEPIGHVDFYVNGGSDQPGCSFRSKRSNLKYLSLAYHVAFENGRCHHLRSINLFTQSLKQAVLKECKFWSHPWESKNIVKKSVAPSGIKKCDETKCIEMGINAELYDHSTNIYYVSTTGVAPYCQV